MEDAPSFIPNYRELTTIGNVSMSQTAFHFSFNPYNFTFYKRPVAEILAGSAETFGVIILLFITVHFIPYRGDRWLRRLSQSSPFRNLPNNFFLRLYCTVVAGVRGRYFY